jgi:NAD dependent epimerase/dehydratase
MNWKQQRVLVTGADGFIGSHLTETLAARGAQVRAFVFYNSFNTWGWLDTLDKTVKDSLEIFPGDVRDPNGVAKAMEGIDVVFHLAALIGIPFSYHSPDSYVDTNIKGTLNILQAARRYQVKKIIHTSTSEIYGTAQVVLITEDHPVNPQSPYAATKAAADQLALSFYRSFDLPVAILRPFNTFGPRQSARAIIPTIVSQLYSDSDAILLGDLTTTRDFNFVDNTVEAFLRLAETPGTEGDVYNSGSGREISIGDLANLIQDITGIRKPIETDRERLRPAKSEVERLLCDASKLRRVCRWQDPVDLREGLAITCRWIQDHLGTFKTEIYNV